MSDGAATATGRASGLHDASTGPGDFDRFFRRRFPEVARAMMLVVRDTDLGEDIAQEAFTRLCERWSRMQSEDHARNFVFKVAWNLVRAHRRRERLRAALGRSVLWDRSERDERERVEERLVLFQALGRLSPRQRACLVLVDYAGFDDQMAASVLGIRPSTVRVHLARGRAAMRMILEQGRPRGGS